MKLHSILALVVALVAVTPALAAPPPSKQWIVTTTHNGHTQQVKCSPSDKRRGDNGATDFKAQACA